jgi:hypothetical protein
VSPKGSFRPPSPSGSSKVTNRVAELDDVREALATELFGIFGAALERFGLDAKQQASAFKRSRRLKEPPKVSGAVLRDTWGLSHLLTEWSRAPQFLDRDGQPRVLAVHGAGDTFESLAKRFLPSKSVAEVVALAQATAEVSLRPRGKIALLGSILVKRTHSRQNLLAHTIRHIDQLLQTVLHNADLQQTPLKPASSRMERLVLGVIRQDRFEDMMADLRPQIYDLLLRVESAVQQRLPLTPDEIKDSTTISVGIYISDEPDWDRAGIDPKTLIPPSSSD